MRKETFFIVPAQEHDALTGALPVQDRSLAALQDRTALHCLAKLRLCVENSGGTWTFRVTRELPVAGRDLRDYPTPRQDVLFIRQRTDHSNVAYVEDFTNGTLEGWGVNRWLLHKALTAFLHVSGPDPWLQGRLSANDRHNPRRVPFWKNQVENNVLVDNHGNGHFIGPWHTTFNERRMKATAVPGYSKGAPQKREPTFGYAVADINGRPAVKMLTEYEAHLQPSICEPAWERRQSC